MEGRKSRLDCGKIEHVYTIRETIEDEITDFAISHNGKEVFALRGDSYTIFEMLHGKNRTLQVLPLPLEFKFTGTKGFISRTIARIRQRIDQARHTWRYGRKQSTWEDFFRIRGNSFDFDHTLTLDFEKLNSPELNSMAWRKIIGLTNRGLILIRCSRPMPYKENVLGYHQVYHKGRLIAQEELRIEGKGASTSLIEIPTFVSIDYCSDPRGEGNLQFP